MDANNKVSEGAAARPHEDHDDDLRYHGRG